MNCHTRIDVSLLAELVNLIEGDASCYLNSSDETVITAQRSEKAVAISDKISARNGLGGGQYCPISILLQEYPF
jgi:hypothetical protein